MGYYVAKYPKYPTAWRVVWRKYERDDTSGQYKAKVRHIPAAEYPRLGIVKEMTLEQVKAVIQKLNAEDRLEQREGQRNNVAKRVKKEREIACAHLPQLFVDKFENEHLATRYLGNPVRLTKVLKLWRAAQRIIRTVKIPTDKWHRYPEHFFAHFEKNAVSPGYAKNILSITNMWLDFLGAEQDKTYRAIPSPKDSWSGRLATAFHDADKAKASLPMSPAMLAKVQPGAPKKMPNDAQYNWLYCSVWAGLRPNEVTALKNPKRTRITDVDGTPVLEVYQSKLKNVPKVEDRWKRIPLFLDEQLLILDIIESGEIEEPLCKTLADRFGEGHSLYAGRKGFHDLMVTTYGQVELEVVRWLGHKSLDMAMKHYAKKTAVRWTPVVKKKKAA